MNTPINTPAIVLKRGFGRRVAGLAALSSLVMLSLSSQAQGMGGPGMMGGPGPQAGPGGPGMMGGPDGMGYRHGARGAHGPADMEKFAERRVEMVIKLVGGTPEQKTRLLAIAKATAADMKPLREQHLQARQKAFGLLAAPTIDRAALEQLRASEIQAADAMSKRMMQSMIESADVLTPEQRAKLAESMKRRTEGRWNR